jgi:crotonobetainyl-CoA:carnitine CoA-transferase CaiB-like acyl-CoA transferase
MIRQDSTAARASVAGMGDGADHAAVEARLLVSELGAATGGTGLAGAADEVAATIPPCDDAARWAASGAMHLTGYADGPPLLPRGPVASRLVGAAAVWTHLTGRQLDGPTLLGERAALRGLSRQGTTSAGGGSRIVRCADGWLAVTLSRPDDLDLVPLWLGAQNSGWEAVARMAAGGAGADLAASGQELGLAVAVVPPPDASPDEQQVARGTNPWLITPTHGPAHRDRLKVLDLSALWAGPLCAQLLGRAGADVVTVDSVSRPDGARLGDPDLFALLHKGHATEPIDLRNHDDRTRLDELIRTADVVITSVRPRALDQLGLWPEDRVRRRPGLTWVAVTAYGLTGPWCNRVGYGDDTAAAGGLVANANGHADAEQPVFCADAAADPSTGLYAAVAALACARAGGGVVDVALREVAHHLSRAPHRTDPVTVQPDRDGWQITTRHGPVPVALPRARTA